MLLGLERKIKMEKISDTLDSNSLLANRQDSNTSNRLIDASKETSNRVVERVLSANQDVIDPRWQERHAKFIYTFGAATYEELAHKARKFGRNPVSYMATLVDREMKNGRLGRGRPHE